MLAPRKTLWSTPDSVIDQVIQSIPLTSKDVVLDIGCGDGRCLIRWAIHVSKVNQDGNTDFPSFVGIDIDSDRIQHACNEVERARKSGIFSEKLSVSFVCENALQATDRIATATVVFLYLIPRGLRLIQPILWEHLKGKARIVSYMAPIPGVSPSEKVNVAVPHQAGACWPLYFYNFEPDGESLHD